MPIEQLQNGDSIAGLTGDQKIIATTKAIINGKVHYALTTQEHGFYIFPDEYVHNMDLAVMPAAATVVIGLLEIINPVTVLIGMIMPLSAYAFNYYLNIKKSQKVELEEALQDASVVQQTRSYYEFKRKELSGLYQNLRQIQNGLNVLLSANDQARSSFSFALMSLFQMKSYDFPLLPNLSVEMKYSVADKQKLLLLRDQELQSLEAQIIDAEILLVFHINELLERRDIAHFDLQEHMKIVCEYVALWDQNSHCLPYSLVIESYRAAFVQEALSVDLENKINEVNFVSTYYGRLNNLVLQRSSNLYEVLQRQMHVNAVCMEYLASLKDNFHKWVKLDEQYLRNAGALTSQLIESFRNEANKRIFDKEKNAIFQAKNKKESIKEQQKNLEQKKDDGGGGGGPGKDPDDDDPLPVNNRGIMMHIFKNETGHLIDTPENRNLLRNLVRDVKNYVGKDNAFNNDWYAKITKEGAQLWARIRNNKIVSGGLNKVPRTWNQETGFCSSIAPRR